MRETPGESPALPVPVGPAVHHRSHRSSAAAQRDRDVHVRRTHANACNLAFVTFSRLHGQLDGRVVAFFTMVVAACEVVVGLAIIMTIYRTRRSANVDDAHLLRH